MAAFGTFPPVGSGAGAVVPSSHPMTEMKRPRRRRKTESQRLAAIFKLPSMGVRVTAVEVQNATLLPQHVRDTLRNHFIGREISPEDARSAGEWLQEWYLSNDYPLNDVVLSHIPSKESGKLVYVARERRLGGIRFRHRTPRGSSGDGPGCTRPQVIYHTLGLKVGSPFHMPSDRFNKLDSLGLFNDVHMKPEHMDDANVFLVIELFEKAHLEVTPAFSVSRRSGFIGGLQFSETNFRGRGQRLSFNASRSQGEENELEIEFTDPRFEGGRTIYGWGLRTVGGRQVSRRFETRVWTLTPLTKTVSVGVDAVAEQIHLPQGVQANQASASCSLVNDHRRGFHVPEGHREELTITRGVNVSEYSGAAGFWKGVVRSGLFSSVLKRRVGIALGVEVHGGGDHSPLGSQSMWEDGEVRGMRSRALTGNWWGKSVAEIRVPVRESFVPMAFAEIARSPGLWSGCIPGTVSSVGIGARVLGSLVVALVAKPNGTWHWKVLPIDRSM